MKIQPTLLERIPNLNSPPETDRSSCSPPVSKTSATTVRPLIQLSRRHFLHTPAAVISTIVSGKDISDRKINALVSLVREVVRQRGYVTSLAVQEFLSAGYNREQVMELLVGVAMKTMSNYLDRISPVPPTGNTLTLRVDLAPL